MKFLADMGISPKTVAHLRQKGFDAVHLHELGLDRLPDDKIMAKANIENYVVLTHDLDFAGLLAASRDAMPSVVIFRLRNMTPANVNVYIDLLIANHSDALTKGAIISVSDSLMRVRLLPI